LAPKYPRQPLYLQVDSPARVNPPLVGEFLCLGLGPFFSQRWEEAFFLFQTYVIVWQLTFLSFFFLQMSCPRFSPFEDTSSFTAKFTFFRDPFFCFQGTLLALAFPSLCPPHSKHFNPSPVLLVVVTSVFSNTAFPLVLPNLRESASGDLPSHCPIEEHPVFPAAPPLPLSNRDISPFIEIFYQCRLGFPLPPPPPGWNLDGFPSHFFMRSSGHPIGVPFDTFRTLSPPFPLIFLPEGS